VLETIGRARKLSNHSLLKVIGECRMAPPEESAGLVCNWVQRSTMKIPAL